MKTKKFITIALSVIALFWGYNSIAYTPSIPQQIRDIPTSDSIFINSATDSISAKTGFTPSVVWVGEAWGDVSNSSNIKNMFDSLLTVEFEQDISKIVGKEGWGAFGISAFYYTQTRSSLEKTFASSQGHFSNIAGGDMARVFEIYYTNTFSTNVGEIAFRIGQLAADEDFMGMDYSDTFLNSSLGALPNVAPVQLFSQYNVATLGVVIYYNIENIDAMLGIYNGNLASDTITNNGFDYAHTFDTVAVWYQLGYSYSIGGLTGRVIAGGNWHSDMSKANFDAIDASGDFYSFYIGLQQAILNDTNGNAKLGAFLRIGYVPESKASEQNFYADFGFNWFAPIAERADDVFGIAFSVIENERTSRQDYAHYEAVIETTYKAQITPAISFQPDMQIFLNSPNSKGEKQTHYIVGARVEIVF